MNPISDLTSLLKALWENDDGPDGIAKAARAEELLAHAEDLNQPEALVKALIFMIQAYERSSHQDRMLVPFARLLRLWDDSPEVFDSSDVHALHWYFKWASSGMLDTPNVARSAIEGWLDEMERRYAIAGYSPRPVWQASHAIAVHLGDDDRAQSALTKWWAATQDEMSDCAACETGERGAWFAHQGDDAAAVAAWGTVLTGKETCAEEPHQTLARALLPLVRLGRLDEACSAHLRGYALIQGSETLAVAVARHIEFCALTGNEGRGLELLADQPGFFDWEGNIWARMRFLAATALLMDRLVTLGRSELVVPGPAGREWTAAGLAAHARAGALADAARFDARNGTDAVSRRIRQGMDATPLLDRLPLGVRSTLPTPPATPDLVRAEPDLGPAGDGQSLGEPAIDPVGQTWPIPAVEAAEERFRLAVEAADHQAARDALTAALALAGEAAPARWRGWALVQLGEAAAAQDDLDAAIGYAREGVYWNDLDPVSFVPRYRLGAHLMAAGRLADAGPVLDQVLADLRTIEDAPEDALVQTLWWLGQVHDSCGEPLRAAEHWAAAARLAQAWEDQTNHAVLSYRVGQALRRANRPEDAAAAFQQAAALFGDLGKPLPQSVAQRAQAWLFDETDPGTAAKLMRHAIATLETDPAHGDPASGDPDEQDRVRELAESWRQHALILVAYVDGEWVEKTAGGLRDAYRSAAHAAELLAGLDDDPDDRLDCALLAGELAHAIGDDQAAEAQLRLVLDTPSATDRAADLRDSASSLRKRLTSQAP